MPIRFNCAECGKTINVPDKAAGRKGRCPSCGASNVVPTESTTGPMTKSGARTRTGAGKKRGRTANLDVDEIIPGEADESEDDMSPVDMDDDIRSLIDSPDSADDLSTGTGRRGRRGGTATNVAMTKQEKRQQEKQAYRDALDALKQKQKGGRVFLWFIFGLILIPTFTAATALLGAYVTLKYAEDPKAYSWFETPASWLGLDEKARKLNRKGAESDADGDGDDGDHDHDHETTTD